MGKLHTTYIQTVSNSNVEILKLMEEILTIDYTSW